jgi:hypothetical protein
VDFSPHGTGQSDPFGQPHLLFDGFWKNQNFSGQAELLLVEQETQRQKCFYRLFKRRA